MPETLLMRQKTFSTTTLPASQEFSFWGRIRSAILGNNRGKFTRPFLSYSPVNQKAILIDVDPGSLMDVAMSVPHLNTVISTGAELFSLMEIKHVDKNGKEIENSPVIEFLRQPNPLQILEQYLYEFYVLNGVYNKTFHHKLQGLSYPLQTIPDALWLLPSGWMKINTTGNLYRQSTLEGIIENYELIANQQKDVYDVDRVIYMAEGIGQSPLNPVSRIEALQIPLSNIVASLKSNNIIITERGMIGFISSDASSNDGDGQLPFDSKESERMRKEYMKQYSLDGRGGHVGFTHAKVKWTPMTFDVAQLGLSITLEESFASICAAYRHDRDIYPSTKGATYENKQQGLKSTITNGLQPLADKLMRQFSKNFLKPGSGEKLIADYSHLPAMKEDERLAAQGRLYQAQANSLMLSDGVISHESYAEDMEIEMTGDKIIQPKAPIQSTPPKE